MRSRSAPRQSTYREWRFCIIKALQTTWPEGANGNKEVFVSPKETFRYSSFVIRYSLFVICYSVYSNMGYHTLDAGRVGGFQEEI
jgi:hypothetical protein